MELTDTQKIQVRLLKLGALLIVVLFGLFIYLSIKYPDAKTSSGSVITETEETYLATTTVAR